MTSVTVRVVCLWLPCLLLLTQCGMIHRVRSIGREETVKPPDPARRGWGLMMSDDEFARYNQGAAATAAGAEVAAGATTEASAFDFSNMLSGQGTGASPVNWQRSATTASRQAKVNGTPMLIYLTHRSSIPAQQMERTLMGMPEFQTLANESFVPLLVDFSDQETNRSTLYRDLKSRYGIRGYPALIVTLPDGTEVIRMTGYKPEFAKRYLEALRDSLVQVEKRISERRAKLEKQDSYRLWKAKDGKPVFARLTGLDATMGIFTGEWGETFKTFLTRLSEEDQAWIAERRK